MMKVEIWSDVMCPFCYIGKHRLEEALQQFDHSGDIKVDWKSFQLRPDMKTQPDTNVTEHLAKAKGWSHEQARQMNRRVTDMAREAGLEFNFNKAVVANSFNAHRFAHYAKTQDKGDAAEEALFKAYFTDGQNTDDPAVLLAMAEKIGLDVNKTKSVLESDEFADSVREDITESRKIGVQGVPFFLFNRKYAVSGAQPVVTFLNALEKSWNEWNDEQQPVSLNTIAKGQVCGRDNDC